MSRKVLLISFLLLTRFMLLPASAQAWTVQMQGQPATANLHYDGTVRLSQVVHDAQEPADNATLAGFVAKKADQAAFIQRRDALIARWSAVNIREDSAAIVQLQEHLRSRQWGGRQDWTLDLDALQITPSLDPHINTDILLRLTPPESGVWVLGAVNQTGIHPFIPGGDVSDYLPAIRHPRAGRDTVAVVQADGKVQWAQVAYWNRIPQAIAPGAVIYIPFESDRWFNSTINDLNQDTVALLAESISE